MKKIFLAISCSWFFNIHAQTNFISKATITYEKTTNQYKSFDDDEEEGEWMKELKKSIPKMVKDNYILQFDARKSVYKLKEENQENKYLWNAKPSENDIIIQNFETKKLTIQRDVFEQTYLIEDSFRNFTWKLTGETREIAGYNCKKAVTKICDSVYVVAFYCDEILCNAGPESFGGLPGLILGLAVPRLGTTWYATKVELPTVDSKELEQPKTKGKKVNWQQLNKDLDKALKDWGKMGKANVWKFNL